MTKTKNKPKYFPHNYGDTWDTRVYKLDNFNICVEDYVVETNKSIRKRYCGYNIGSLRKMYFSHVFFNMFEMSEDISAMNPNHHDYMEKATNKCKKDLGELWDV